MAISSDQLAPKPRARVAFAAFAGLCAILIGIGLARFGYTPIIPALISERWFDQSGTAYLGAANFGGYLAGALLGHIWIRWFRAATVLRALMLATALSFVACAWKEGGFAWIFFWRALSGYTGGAIMILAAPTVLLATPPGRRGLVSGTIFTGVGIGIVASGTLVPFLLALGGVQATWLGLGAVSLLLTLASWGGWPRAILSGDVRLEPAPRARMTLPVAIILLGYALYAAGVVPHVLFLVVYIAHELDRGLEVGAGYWILVGIGAMAGPICCGQLGDWIGFRRATLLAFALGAVTVLLPYLSASPISLTISSLVVGAYVPGIASLTLGRVHEAVEGHAAQHRAWGQATIAWAIAQSGSAFVYSYLIGKLGGYAPLFAIGAAVLLLALAADLALGLVSRSRA